MTENNNKKSAASFFGLPTAKVTGSAVPPFNLPKVILGNDEQGNEVAQDWTYIGRLLLGEFHDQIEFNGFLDLDKAFQTSKNPDVIETRDIMIAAQEKKDDKPKPYCGRKLWIGMLKLKNDGTGTLSFLKQTKTQSWQTFIYLIPYQHELFYPEGLVKNIDELKKTEKDPEKLKAAINEEVGNFFSQLMQTAVKNKESPYPTQDCTIYMKDELKERVIVMAQGFNLPDYSYTLQGDCTVCFIGGNVSKSNYNDKVTGLPKVSFNLNVDDVWLFRPDPA